MNFRKQVTTLGLSIFVLLLAACAPAAQENEVPVTGGTQPADTPSVPVDLPPEAVLNAQQWLSDQLSVAIEQVRIVEVEQAVWTDSCLGLGGANESCLRADTPGWRAVFDVNGQTYEVRTDETASTIRMATP